MEHTLGITAALNSLYEVDSSFYWEKKEHLRIKLDRLPTAEKNEGLMNYSKIAMGR